MTFLWGGMSHRNKQFDVGADRITILSRNFVHCGIGDMLKIFFARLPVNGGSCMAAALEEGRFYFLNGF